MDVIEEAAKTLKTARLSLHSDLFGANETMWGMATAWGSWIDVLHRLSGNGIVPSAADWYVCYPGPNASPRDVMLPADVVPFPAFPPRPDAPAENAADWSIRLPADADPLDPPAGANGLEPSRWTGGIPNVAATSAAACLTLAAWEPDEQPEPNRPKNGDELSGLKIMAKSARVTLYVGGVAVVDGTERSKLSAAQFMLVRVLLAAYPHGLTKDKLEKRCQSEAARRTMSHLAEEPGWRDVLKRPGQPGAGGYRIL